ncbi:RidA family protein [Streptomyces sp. SBT349]|uniref:RidA family protein n=1 Tax=Streptomyces sp. SBT349 TaxID=1580539 RepID=UPI00066E9B3D|nr:RidA family protein [Streptomyces sp. SBT349]
MSVTLTNPEGMPTPVPLGLYRHVAVATGTRTVTVAGQVGWNSEGELVSDTLRGQLVQAFRNVRTALESVGGTFEDLVRVTVYAARWSPGMTGEFEAAVADIREEMGWSPAPLSMIGVDILYMPEILVEVEATAVLP